MQSSDVTTRKPGRDFDWLIVQLLEILAGLSFGIQPCFISLLYFSRFSAAYLVVTEKRNASFYQTKFLYIVERSSLRQVKPNFDQILAFLLVCKCFESVKGNIETPALFRIQHNVR